jgi:hypothetical protein
MKCAANYRLAFIPAVEISFHIPKNMTQAFDYKYNKLTHMSYIRVMLPCTKGPKMISTAHGFKQSFLLPLHRHFQENHHGNA